VALFTPEPFYDRAYRFIYSESPIAIVSDLAVAEFSSAVSRLYRMKLFTEADCQDVFANFDTWTARETQRIKIESADILSGSALVRRLEFGLRAPDAIHLAIARRLTVTLATFDDHMMLTARKLGLEVAKV
jgi:predicted nucleic acid-binding protein